MKHLKTFENFELNEGLFLTIFLYVAAAYSLWMLFWKYLRYYADKYRDHPEEQPIVKVVNGIIKGIENFNKAGNKYLVWATLTQLKYSRKLQVKEDETLLIITTDSGEEITINKKEIKARSEKYLKSSRVF